MQSTKQQVIAINTALHYKNLMGHKAEIIDAVTNGRTSSSKELTYDEAYALLQDLNKDNVTADEGKRMRNNIIAMAHEIGWIKKKNGKNDYRKLDTWMKESSYLKKKLYDYSYKELPTLVTVFKKIYLSALNKVGQ
jgi:hypothetical protein